MNIGVARQRAVVVEPIDVELALPLDREEQPRLARMEVEMARAEAEPIAAARSMQVRQHAVLEAIDLERAGVFRLAGFRIVAARDHDRGLVARRGQHLMRENADVELLARRDLFAERAVRLDAMDRDVARIIVRGEQIAARAVDAAMHRPRRQRRRPPCGVSAPEAGSMRNAVATCLVPGMVPGPAVARHRVEKFLRRVRPDVLDVGAGDGDQASRLVSAAPSTSMS